MAIKKISASKKNKTPQNISKYSFLSWISHELRSPISSINAAASLLAMPGILSEAEKKECIDGIINACEDSNKFIDDLLEIGRAESGDFEATELTEENIADLFTRSIKLVKGKAIRNSIMIKAEVAKNCTKIKCDSTRFKQILANLFIIAINHSPSKATITIDAKMAKGGRKIQISIKDQGPGMSKENIKKALQKFKISKDNNFRMIDPLGLDLPLIKYLVEKHNGTLAIKSEIGFGNEFIITLPLYTKSKIH